jgi:hypothetical protein
MFDDCFVSYLLVNIGLRDNKTQLSVGDSSLFIGPFFSGFLFFYFVSRFFLLFSLQDRGIVKKEMRKKNKKKIFLTLSGRTMCTSLIKYTLHEEGKKIK